MVRQAWYTAKHNPQHLLTHSVPASYQLLCCNISGAATTAHCLTLIRSLPLLCFSSRPHVCKATARYPAAKRSSAQVCLIEGEESQSPCDSDSDSMDSCKFAHQFYIAPIISVCRSHSVTALPLLLLSAALQHASASVSVGSWGGEEGNAQHKGNMCGVHGFGPCGLNFAWIAMIFGWEASHESPLSIGVPYGGPPVQNRFFLAPK